MIVEEVKHDSVGHTVHLLVWDKLWVVADAHCCKDELRELSKDTIVIIFADGEVHVVAGYHVQVHVANLFNVFPFTLVRVTGHLFSPKTVPKF